MKDNKNYSSFVAVLATLCLFTGGAIAAEGFGVSAQDQQFINQAWNMNTAEIRLGQLAQEKAANADVRAIGARMITDRFHLNEQLSHLAAETGATLPKELDQPHQELLEKLSGLSGSEFDSQYITAMMDAQAAAVDAFQRESRSTPVTATAVTRWAVASIAELKNHQQLAQKTGKELGLPEHPVSERQPGR